MSDELREAARRVDENCDQCEHLGHFCPDCSAAAQKLAGHYLTKQPTTEPRGCPRPGACSCVPQAGADDGVTLIAVERQRQVDVERWDKGHDDEHDDGQLAIAAAAYSIPPDHSLRVPDYNSTVPKFWPFERLWWKPVPDDRIRELVKAGALIAAEIDRLNRKALGITLSEPEGGRE